MIDIIVDVFLTAKTFSLNICLVILCSHNTPLKSPFFIILSKVSFSLFNSFPGANFDILLIFSINLSQCIYSFHFSASSSSYFTFNISIYGAFGLSGSFVRRGFNIRINKKSLIASNASLPTIFSLFLKIFRRLLKRFSNFAKFSSSVTID